MTCCADCGEDQVPGTGFACSYEPGDPPQWLCPDCTREHARDIEAKLAPEWW